MHTGMSACNTVYPNREGMSTTSLVALGYFNISVTVINVILNVFLCFALWKTGQLYKLSSRFIFCLSISDIFVALTTQNMVSYLLLSESKTRNCKIEASSHFFSFTLNQFSGDMILIIALDRYLHMKFLNKYPTKMTAKRGILLVILNVAISLFGGITATLVALLDGCFVWHWIFVSLDSAIIMTVIILYIGMYLTVRKMAGRLNLNTGMSASENQLPSLKLKERKSSCRYNFTLARTVSFVLVSMLLSYLPYFCLGSISTYYYHIRNEEPSNQLKIAVYFSIILVYMNCSFSVIIFVLFNNGIKRFLVKLFHSSVNTSFPSSDNSQSS